MRIWFFNSTRFKMPNIHLTSPQAQAVPLAIAETFALSFTAVASLQVEASQTITSMPTRVTPESQISELLDAIIPDNAGSGSADIIDEGLFSSLFQLDLGESSFVPA